MTRETGRCVAMQTLMRGILSPIVVRCIALVLLIALLWTVIVRSIRPNSITSFSLIERNDDISKPDDAYLAESSSSPITQQTPQISVELRTDPLTPLSGEKLCDRWVVITSIQAPTDDIRLLGQLEKLGWRVLVVGDKSTPSDYKAPPGVRFLGHEEATTKLGYNLLTYMRWKAYTVKNIGYLFAIQHGAKMIYDTDDDNHPIDNMKSVLELAGYGYFGNETKRDTIRTLVLNPENPGDLLPVINPLPHFGQVSLWPRGFPLTEIARPTPRSYKLCTTHALSWIQGVVNGDPDMDAVFRLTRKHITTRLNLTFDRAPPLVLPQGFFIQSNSQNTFFAEKALALLLLPFSKTINWRECDIWRGYIGQALMWIFGARKGYVAPNAFQFRNPHNYLIDFNDEINVYKFAGRLIDFLAKWKCPDQYNLGQCFVRVYEDLFAEHLIATQFDVDVAKAWITDLERMNYKFPPRKTVPNCVGNGKDDERVVQFFPIELPLSVPANPILHRLVPINVLGNVSSTKQCSAVLPLEELFDPVVAQDIATLVIFIAKSEKNAELSTERLNLLYAPYFARRIFCLTSERFFTSRLTNLKATTLVEANSGVDCLKQVWDFYLETSAYVLLTINVEESPLALLSPNGVKIVAAFSDGNTEIMSGACDKNSGPAVVMAKPTVIPNLSPNQLLDLCKSNSTNEKNNLSISQQCSSSESAILLNCQALSAVNWTVPFCRV